jgi:mono/diheme cytochrome c family protein
MLGRILLLLAFVAVASPGNIAWADEKPTGEQLVKPTGEQLYVQQCARCHGAAGEGVKDKYAKPLVGDRPLDDLAQLIAETMPEDHPETCVGEDAVNVAKFIYVAFYSKEAQARNSRPRVELTRLTVRQYRETAADLVGSFSDQNRWDAQRGLQGQYFHAKDFRSNKRVFERRDATVGFHFGEASPVTDEFDTEEFAIRWQGSLLTLETGEYELNIKTENGARLWLNDLSQPLIDASVRSGSERDHRQTIHLLGGRVYPLRLEFFKTKADQTIKTASIALMWKPPRGVEEVIPERHLSPHQGQPSLVVQTAFPPDDRSTGYERGTSVSKAWDEAETYAAIEVADYVVGRLAKVSGVGDDAPDRADRLRDFCRRFVERAFRRPLTHEQRTFFVDRHFDSARDPKQTVKKVLLLTLKSPRFLYREVGGEPMGVYDAAARLSFTLWDSMPDPPLWKAAAASQLSTPEQVAGQAERMLADPRTKAKLREFLHQWLKVDQVDELRKDGALFPEFNEAVAADLRTSLDLFLDDVIWGETSDFRQLFLADYLYLNGRLANVYGVKLLPEAPFQRVALDPGQRSGIVSHPFLMARFAYHATSSPIHRGVFVVRSLLGRQLRPPPEAVAPLSPELHPEMTTRERVTLQTSPASCATCHAIINPLGFPLEHYDALGRFRAEEKGRPVDDAGYYQTLAGQRIELRGARELATFLASSEETQAAFVEQLFHYLVKQPIRAFGVDRPEQLRRSFAASGFNVRRLLVEIASVAALHGRPEPIAAK